MLDSRTRQRQRVLSRSHPYHDPHIEMSLDAGVDADKVGSYTYVYGEGKDQRIQNCGDLQGKAPLFFSAAEWPQFPARGRVRVSACRLGRIIRTPTSTTPWEQVDAYQGNR